MFELCAEQHQIIIEYKDDRMALIAIRENSTGAYVPLSTLVEESNVYNIPMVGIF